jgi:hypothetical protein
MYKKSDLFGSPSVHRCPVTIKKIICFFLFIPKNGVVPFLSKCPVNPPQNAIFRKQRTVERLISPKTVSQNVGKCLIFAEGCFFVEKF